jgi:hypothetical protein
MLRGWSYNENGIMGLNSIFINSIKIQPFKKETIQAVGILLTLKYN